MQIKGWTPSIGKLQEVRDTWPSAVGPFDLPPPPPSSAMDVKPPVPEAPAQSTSSHKKASSTFSDEITQREESHPQARWTQAILTEQIEKRALPEIFWRNKIHPTMQPSPTISGRNTSHRRKNTTSSIRQRTRSMASPSQQNVAPPSISDGEQNLGLDRLLSTIYTSARRFRGPHPSSMPDRLSERNGAGGIAAGSFLLLGVALFAPLHFR